MVFCSCRTPCFLLGTRVYLMKLFISNCQWRTNKLGFVFAIDNERIRFTDDLK